MFLHHAFIVLVISKAGAREWAKMVHSCNRALLPRTNARRVAARAPHAPAPPFPGRRDDAAQRPLVTSAVRRDLLIGACPRPGPSLPSGSLQPTGQAVDSGRASTSAPSVLQMRPRQQAPRGDALCSPDQSHPHMSQPSSIAAGAL